MWTELFCPHCGLKLREQRDGHHGYGDHPDGVECRNGHMWNWTIDVNGKTKLVEE